MPNKYVLLAGGHSDGKQSYEPGDVVESTTALDERFPEKFSLWTPEDEASEPPPENEDDR